MMGHTQYTTVKARVHLLFQHIEAPFTALENGSLKDQFTHGLCLQTMAELGFSPKSFPAGSREVRGRNTKRKELTRTHLAPGDMSAAQLHLLALITLTFTIEGTCLTDSAQVETNSPLLG